MLKRFLIPAEYSTIGLFNADTSGNSLFISSSLTLTPLMSESILIKSIPLLYFGKDGGSILTPITRLTFGLSQGSSPRRITLPLLGLQKPTSSFIRLDFPLPLGPTMRVTPSLIFSETFLNTSTFPIFLCTSSNWPIILPPSKD
ncbi:143aa long hypothetical protein [Pyrococcus horikoshii OT3]|uniref:Uncharacterized protein n=1 Tax=Pyrococcus horikoshii (strain ATCC 700860 / DSM 12428 / JCM 9974 / NBRC 100139 / OT-3) TaxID=70601 RepID=O59160_PYRHO|nr:143aa long hypothetical protein [Pyrococcus horikoshii OT3]